MKFTKIKSIKDKTINTSALANELVAILAKKGFVTGVDLVTGTSFKLGMHGCSFIINTEKLGHNLRKASSKSVTGYKRTNIPTWDQRVAYNLIVQKFFDKHNLTAKIVSGKFVIRDGYENMTEHEWRQVMYSNNYEDRVEAMTKDYEQEEKDARKERARKLAEEKRARMCNAEKFIVDSKKNLPILKLAA